MELELAILIVIALLISAQIVFSLYRQRRNGAESARVIEESLLRHREMMATQMSTERNSMLGEFANWQNTINASINSGRQDTELRLRSFAESVEKKLLEIERGSVGSAERINRTLEEKLRYIQENNEKRLGEMQRLVDEKMQETLNSRISTSFQSVQASLESVQKGIGEMQGLAQDARDLKNVLTNVKTRGEFGEVILGSLLSDILTPEQYVENYQVGKNSVEFAVKMPGMDGVAVMLPIDSKFPYDDYNRLLEATDPNEIREYRRNLYNSLKKFADDISQKYIDVSITTNFAIMFLPTEGLYAEAIRNAQLINEIRREKNIVIAGPTTFAALLSSLQIGFKTLAIEKKSAEVWSVLSSVKKSFEGMVSEIDKAKKQLGTLEKTMGDLSGKRVRAVVKALQNVEITGEAGLGDGELNFIEDGSEEADY